jgi:hypoxanthine phosphoribosyltransferase
VTIEAAKTERHAWAVAELGEVLLSGEQIQARVAELGRQITDDYQHREPLLICVLKGAMHFLTDLSRAIELPVEIDFMAVSSYGSSTQTSGVVRIVKDLDRDLKGRDVIVVEDIVDSGLTLKYLQRYLLAREPASLEVCTLLARKSGRRNTPDVAYVGFEVADDSFVVGYGLDVAERYRNLDGIYHFAGGTSTDGR